MPRRFDNHFMKNDITVEQARRRLAALCSKSEHSSGEMLAKMRRWGLSDAEQDEVLTSLIETHYVDDERYARAYVRDKLTFEHWGRRKIDAGLWQKGISEELRSVALAEIDEQEYAEVLRTVIDRRCNDPREKIVRYALSRGFEYDIILANI